MTSSTQENGVYSTKTGFAVLCYYLKTIKPTGCLKINVINLQKVYINKGHALFVIHRLLEV